MNDQPPSLPQTKNALSVTSLVLGILGIIPCSIFAGIPAVITGHIALSRAKKSPQEYGGKGMATAGLIMGYLSIALGVLLLPASLLLPALAKAKARAQRVQCISNIKMIGLAARIYANDHGGRFPIDFVTMSNELNTPKVLHCPADTRRTRADDWDSFSSANVSYEFLLPGGDTSKPQEVLVRCPLHNNVGLADGSAQQLPMPRRRD
jgi:hypothetical protein